MDMETVMRDNNRLHKENQLLRQELQNIYLAFDADARDRQQRGFAKIGGLTAQAIRAAAARLRHFYESEGAEQ